MTRKLISVVVPLHNEALNVPILYKELLEAGATTHYNFEYLFVDDGSEDDSADAVRTLRMRDPNVHLLEFARNFGKEAAVSAGLHHSRGDAAIIMDADLQHPPSLLPHFLQRWEEGYEVVVGVRQYDKREGMFKRFASTMFYKIMQRISHTQITPHATDFRLLDRTVINEFNKLSERNRMTRGLIDWLGFKRGYVHFTSQLRRHGEASYGLSKLISLAMNSFTAYSLMPLRLAGYLGVLILMISAPLGVFVVIEKYIMHDPLGLQFSGPATLAIILLFMVGVMLACLGLVALYIAHIHAEVLGRPLYVVRPQPMPALNNTEVAD